MTLEKFYAFAEQTDVAFLMIGLAILAIEIAKALFTHTFTRTGFFDMVASVSTQIPYLVVEIFLMSFVYYGFTLIDAHWVTWQLPVNAVTVVAALVLADFTYYWEHRAGHMVRILWTQHAVHHSSRFMNVTVAIRFGPLESLTSAAFHLPLLFLGFPAELVFASIIIVLAYQTWLHTELINKLGPLEGILNTPSNHRVHHGADDAYLDRNFGGILIIWDRLLGTYQPETVTPTYGLRRDFDSVNPLRVWVSEWPGLWHDLKSARTDGTILSCLFSPPGKPQSTDQA